jgi:hypothetical protein
MSSHRLELLQHALAIKQLESAVADVSRLYSKYILRVSTAARAFQLVVW